MIVHFTECKEYSTVASARIARYLSSMLEDQLWDVPSKYEIKSYDRLIIVNGPFAFCSFLPQIGELVRLAKEVVWVQNDYAISPPGANSSAESPFRKAFADRKLRPNFWTTVEKNVKTSDDKYVNWNALTYNPPLERCVHPIPGMYYHGAFRIQRLTSFNRFLCNTPYEVWVDTTGKQRRDKFSSLCGKISFVNTEGSLLERINRFQCALYIEDDRSHREFHSPANRFYEYLSANVPIIFDMETRKTMDKAGITINRDWCALSAREVGTLMNYTKELIEEQKVLHKDYRAELDKQVLELK